MTKMRKFLLLTRWAIIAAVFIIGTRTHWVTEAGLDFWNLPQLNEQVEENLKVGEELEAASEAVHHRMALKEELVHELVDGRTDLLTVAAQFRNLNAVYDDYLELLHLRYEGLTDEECICRNVIDYVRVALTGDLCAGTVLVRLEREFQTFHACRGLAHLPA